ncbi:hypothetical protein BDM02DRAFT_3117386 [Thelephora ganbajun]|uniref:Uncharacterized protein n=1 Tax=Thelephora ganbajun TaxID=370292 RepID=A0ACB6ZD80_THEGA|nr:hypothetical protein BDM02DRAFT_3117386 [Thelephora ganbajun]
MTTRIPPELIFHIISFLRDDKAALSACSTCCSALTAAVKPLLFRILRTRLDPKAADRFECLLESDPGVLSLIKRIDVIIQSYKPEVDQRAIKAISQIMDYPCIRNTTPALKIAIQPKGPILHQFGGLILPRLYPVIHWVTSLQLEELDLGEDVQFWHLVLAFPNLKSLILGCVKAGRVGFRIPSHCKSEISHLSLKESALNGSCDMRRFLADHPMPLPSLTSFDVRVAGLFDLAPLHYAEQYGPTVKTLRFGVTAYCIPSYCYKLGCKF